MATGIPLIDVPLRLLGLEWDPGYEQVNYWDTPEGKRSWDRVRAEMDKEMHGLLVEGLRQCLCCGQGPAVTRNWFGEAVCQDCQAQNPPGPDSPPLAWKPLPWAAEPE